MGMLKIVVILVCMALALGLIGGILRTYLHFLIPSGGAYIGAGIGVVAAILLAKHAQASKQTPPRKSA
jgi:hypothetical protein